MLSDDIIFELPGMLHRIEEKIDTLICCTRANDQQKKCEAFWYYDGAVIKCSKCNKSAIEGFQTCYCPNCGAKMEVE